MILDRWCKETHCYIFEALNGVHHWDGDLIDFFKAEMIRRFDDKEYEFSYANLPRLGLNDVEDMYLFQVQDKLHHLPLEFVKDFNNALLLFIRRVVIQNEVEDIQLRVESYQQTLNLTKPMMFFEGIDKKIPFTMSGTHKGVVYLNQHNIKSFMKLSEVKKFYDGTLIKIRENLVGMVKRNKMGTGNKRLKGRDWTDMDVEKSNEMVDKIDKVLKHREQLRRLEEYVGGRPKTVNLRTFVRPMFRRFLDNKLKEGERMWHLIEKGPYVRPMIPDPDDTREQIVKLLSKMTEITKKQYIADVRIINYLLQAIPNDIYNLVDASKEGESLESVYERLTTLVNITGRNKFRPIPVSINTKFLNSSKAKRAAKNYDPIALIDHSNASSSQSHASPSYSNSPQPYFVTHPSSVVDYEVDYQGELHEDSQEDKLITAMMNAGRQNRNQAFNAGNGLTQNDESNQIVQRVPRTESNPGKPNVVSEVNASHEMIPKGVHEHKNHGKRKTIINTFDDDQIESNIIFDDPYVENNGESDEHDSNTHLAKKTFKERENRYLEDLVDLEEKLSSHDRIVYKMGQSIQTIHMLGKIPNKVYDHFLKAGLGYQNPERLKKAIAAQPKMYHGEML
ncbi:hypothetical protein Tco_1027267 [Tanacetum coccineum]